MPRAYANARTDQKVHRTGSQNEIRVRGARRRTRSLVSESSQARRDQAPCVSRRLSLGDGPFERLMGTKAGPADARCRAAWRRRGRILECSMGKRMSGPGCSFATLAKRGLGRPRHSRPRLRSGFRSIRRHPRNVRFRRFGDGSAWDAAACNLVAEPDHERDTRAR